ncbi:TOBE domain-containing protein, partial [Paraburkholderia sp. SIMBA_009]
GLPAIVRDVALVEQLGEAAYVHLDQPGGVPLLAKLPGQAALRRGERHAFSVPPSCCHLFDDAGIALPAIHAEAAFA